METVQVNVTYRESTNKWGERIIKKVTVRSKGYQALVYEDPEGLNVRECASDYVSYMGFPPCEVEIVHGKYYGGEPRIEGQFGWMGKLVLPSDFGFVEPDEEGIPVDLSEYGL